MGGGGGVEEEVLEVGEVERWCEGEDGHGDAGEDAAVSGKEREGRGRGRG